MSIYRSQTVQRFKLYLPRQSAWNIMDRLGNKQLVHIIPSKSDDIIRHFTFQVRRIEEALLKISKFEEALISKKMSEPMKLIDKEKMQEAHVLFKSFNHDQISKNSTSQVNTIIESIDQLWDYYSQVNKRIEMLDKEVQNARENISILLIGQKQYGRSFFSNQRERQMSYDKVSYYSVNKINYKAGVIKISEQLRFKRTVFRISKGNCLIMTRKVSEVFPELQTKQKERVVFFVIYPANNENYFDKKLTKLIGNFCDRSFDYYSYEQNSFEEILEEYRKSYSEALSLKEMCEHELQSFLYEKLLQKFNKKSVHLSQLKKYEFLKLYLIKEKEIYQNLNQMDIYTHFFQAQIFVRKQDVKEVQQILSFSQAYQRLPPGNIIPINTHHQKYPTSFVLNDYTRPSQEIVDTYGVPRYKQINPSIFTTITFPFLFGVMFGDIGHGLILLGFGLWLIMKIQSIRKMDHFILNMVLPYRYLIGLMGFFATYCGFIYNDFLSMSLNLFGSCYVTQNAQQGQLVNRISSECTYPIGLDPIWSVANNSLNFTNSLKMKISVIIGVIHMTVGVILRALNDIYFKNYKQVVFVFTSQLVFLIAFFGYMDFLIIYKWLIPWGTQRQFSMAPSIINQMIAIPLSMGSTQGKPLWNQYSQQKLQYLLLVVAGIAVPLMFFPVPLMKIFKIERRKTKKEKIHINASKYSSSSDVEKEITEILMKKQYSQDFQEEQQENQKFELTQQETPSQIFVHQAIQTIEFVLGCVSNTASYLRLWALSLAHSQLSQVFFQKTVEGSLEQGWSGIPMNLIGFCILASTTTGIMLLMDTMECFLHTLRLHWVQFQNKFYKGDGFLFKNYSFREGINSELKKSLI